MLLFLKTGRVNYFLNDSLLEKSRPSLLHQGLSELELYGDKVYKFEKIMDRADFSDQFNTNVLTMI